MIKKIIIIFFLIGLYLLICPIVKASNEIDQSHWTGFTNTLSDQFLFGQRFTPTQNNISKIDLLLNTSDTIYATTTLTICKGTGEYPSMESAYANALTCNLSGNSLVWSGEVIGIRDGITQGSTGTFTLPTPQGLDIGEPYHFVFKINHVEQGNDAIHELYSTVDPPAGGIVVAGSQWREYYDTTYTGTPTLYFNLDYPVPPTGSIYVGMPSTIDYTYLNPTNTYDQVSFYITQLSPIRQQLPIIHNVIYQNMATTTATTTPINLGNGDYYLQAFFANCLVRLYGYCLIYDYIDEDNPVATSTFQVGYATTTPFTLCDTKGMAELCPDVNFEAGWFDLLTDEFGDLFKCFLLFTEKNAFCPSQDSLDTLLTSYSNLKGSFPFSAYYQFADIIEENIASTTTNFNGGLKIPSIGGITDGKAGNFTMITVIGSTTLTNAIGESNNNLFRNSLSWALWILAGYFIYITIKKI